MKLNKMKVLEGVEALIFDLDGTLADTMPIHFMAYKHILKNFGIDFTPEIFITMAGVPAIETVEKLNGMFGTKMDPVEIGLYKEQEYEKIMHKMKPVEPVVELAKKYYGILPMAVGTGGYKKLAMKTLEIIGMSSYFSVLVSAEDVSHPKPHPETFLKCAELMGVKPEICQVFEDGPPGMEAARRAGMKALLVTDYYETSIGKEIL